jgi:hypothetical protein
MDFERKKCISKEGYSINRPIPWQILSGSFEGVWNLATKPMMKILSSGLYDQIDYVQNLTVHIKYLLDINSEFRYCYQSVIIIRLIT